MTARVPVPPVQMPGTTQTPHPAAQTVSQYFQAHRLVQWWTNPSQRFGQNGEQGTDFGVPLNTPIGSIAAGKVIVSNYSGDPSLGYVIQIAGAQGQLWHYQHLATATVKAGQTVQVGQVIGNSGGPPGRYSTGPHIEVRYAPSYNAALAQGSGVGAAYWSDAVWVDSFGQIQRTAQATGGAAGAPPSATGGGGIFSAIFSGLLGFAQTSTTTPVAGPSFQLPKVQLAPTSDVTVFLEALDVTLEVINPFDVQNVQQDSILGATFPDPISWIEGFGFNLVEDLGALTGRVFLILFGGYLIFKVSGHFINYQAVADTATKAISTGVMLA